MVLVLRVEGSSFGDLTRTRGPIYIGPLAGLRVDPHCGLFAGCLRVAGSCRGKVVFWVQLVGSELENDDLGLLHGGDPALDGGPDWRPVGRAAGGLEGLEKLFPSCPLAWREDRLGEIQKLDDLGRRPRNVLRSDVHPLLVVPTKAGAGLPVDRGRGVASRTRRP